MNYMVTVEVVSSGKHLFVLVKTLQSVSEFAFDKCGFTQTNTHVLTHCSVHYGDYVLPRVNCGSVEAGLHCRFTLMTQSVRVIKHNKILSNFH